MKTIYLAGKLRSGELSISEFADELEERGHTVLEKWWDSGKLPTPYLENPKTSVGAAQAMLDAAYNSEVTILFPDDKILGAAVEFEAALASVKVKPEKLIIVVNPFNVRQSVFYAHPLVTAVSGIAQIREADWY